MAIKGLGQITMSAAGPGVDSTTYYYYLSNSSTKPDPPEGYEPSSPWTTEEPAYQVGNTDYLYTVIRTVYKDNTYEYSNVNLSSSYEAIKQTYQDIVSAENDIDALKNLGLNRGYIWQNTTQIPAHDNIPVYSPGAYVASGILGTDFDTTNSDTYGLNTWTGTFGIKMRYNAIDLASLSTSALEFYYPSMTQQGSKAIWLGVENAIPALIFYSFMNEEAMRLTSNGMKLSRGGIESGSINTSDYIYVWSHDGDVSHTLNINNSGNKNDWRIVAGNNFGVDKSGNLYAANANISGTINATNGYISSSVQIGGRPQSELFNNNLLRGTRNITIGTGGWAAGEWYLSGSGGKVETGIIVDDNESPVPGLRATRITITESGSPRYGFAQAHVSFEAKKITQSVWVKGTAGDKITLQPIWAAPEEDWAESGDREFTIPDSEWHQYRYTNEEVHHNHPGGGHGDTHSNNYAQGGYVYFRSATVNNSCLVLGNKVEYGKPSGIIPWKPWTDVSGDTDGRDYITKIDNNGIRIHPASTLKDSILLNGDGLKIYKNNNLKASYGDEIYLYSGNGQYPRVKINSTSGVEVAYSINNYMQISSGGLTVLQGGTPIARFGSVIELGEYSTLGGFSVQIAQHDSGGGIAITKVGSGTLFNIFTQLSDGHITAQMSTPSAGLNFNPGNITFNLGNTTNSYSFSNSECFLGGSTGVSGFIQSNGHQMIRLVASTSSSSYKGLYDPNNEKWMWCLKYGETDRYRTAGHIMPNSDNALYMGLANNRWKAVYAVNGTIQTSDTKAKDILGTIDYAEDLIMGLEPVDFMWKDGDHRRKRMGFKAQQSAQLCKELNQNLAFVTASYKENNDLPYYGEDVDDELLNWGMVKEELIAPLVKVVQNQQKEIQKLKTQVQNLSLMIQGE